MYDVTNEKSFENLKTWLQEIEAYASSPKIVKLLVGNKIDLVDRKVTSQEAEQWAREHGMIYLECSAKSSINIKQAFEEVVEKVSEIESLMFRFLNQMSFLREQNRSSSVEKPFPLKHLKRNQRMKRIFVFVNKFIPSFVLPYHS